MTEESLQARIHLLLTQNANGSIMTHLRSDIARQLTARVHRLRINTEFQEEANIGFIERLDGNV